MRIFAKGSNMMKTQRMYSSSNLPFRTLHLRDDFPNLTWLPCAGIRLWYIFQGDPIGFSRDMSRIVEKCPISQFCRFLHKFLDLDPKADDFQNFISSSLSTDRLTNLHLCGKNFHEDPFSSFHVKLLTHKQTDRQTPGKNITSLTGVIMISRLIHRWQFVPNWRLLSPCTGSYRSTVVSLSLIHIWRCRRRG